MGRHGRPEADALAGVDVAAELEAGPVVDVTSPIAPSPARRHRRSPESGATEPASTSEPARDDELSTSLEPPETTAPPTLSPPLSTVTASMVGATVVAHLDRKAIREARRAATRRRLLVAGAGVLVLLLIIGVTAVVLSSRDDVEPVTSAPRTPRQSTLLVQVAGQDGTAVVNALVGVTASSSSGAALLIPAGLLVDDASSGNLPFGETLTLPSKTASIDALTDLLGVRVSNAWVLSQQGIGALVDEVGGVQVTVDVDVIVKNAKGDEAVVARAGSQRLNGAQAAAYATYLAAGEPEAVRLPRFNDVFDEVLRSLPATTADIATTLTGLSTGSSSALTPAQLAKLLIVMRGEAVKEQLRYDVLPVNDIDTGDTVDTYGLDSGKANAMLASMFASSLLKDGAGDVVRVLVENGVGTPDLVTKARATLVKDGFQFITGGNAADLSDTEPSVVLIADGSNKSQARGGRVAKSLGLPASSIEINPRGQTVADIIVILGADFRP